MIGQRVTDFLQFLRFEKRFSPHTLISYQTDLEQFREYVSAQFSIDSVKSISHFHVRSWLAALKDEKQAPRTLNRKLSSLNSFYKYLMRQQTVSKNPVKQLHAVKSPERLPAYLKEQEAEFLMEEVQFEEGFKGATDRLICELFYQTGMRRQELLQLKEIDIEWSLGQIRVLGKGNKERLIPIHELLADGIREFIA